MTKSNGNKKHGQSWNAADERSLKSMARRLTAREAAKVLGRTPAAVQQKAMRLGLSFR